MQEIIEILHPKKTINDIPGPEEKPGMGNLEDIQKAGDLAHFQLEIHKKYGRLVKFKIDANTVALSTTDVEVLKKIGKIFEKPASLYEFLNPLIGDLLLLDIEPNKEVRKLVIDKFSNHLVKKKFTLLQQQLREEINAWFFDSNLSGGIIKIQERLKALSMKLTVALVCGQDFKESGSLAKAMHNSLQELLSRQYRKPYSEELLKDSLSYIDEQVKNFIRTKEREGLKSEEEKVFLDELLEHFANDMTPETQEKISNITKMVLMAGYHTIASGTCWTLYAIAKHPAVAQKVYAEIDQLTGKNEIDYATLSKFKYLPLVLKEVLRRYAPAPYTARILPEEQEIDGYLIPKNTIIYYPLWAVHMDPEYWPSPETFDPDRKHNSLAYMPFGVASRVCTGMNSANTEMMLMLTQILKEVQIGPAPGFEPKISENFVLTSKNDIELQISPRRKLSFSAYPNNIAKNLKLSLNFATASFKHFTGKELRVLFGILLIGLLYYTFRETKQISSLFFGTKNTPLGSDHIDSLNENRLGRF